MSKLIPARIGNWIGAEERFAASGEVFDKLNPHNGRVLWSVARSNSEDVAKAVSVATEAQPQWGELPAVERGAILNRVVGLLEKYRAEVSEVVASETGKSPKDAWGETGGAISLGLFYVGEGQRLYGRTTTSAVPARQSMTVREPVGVAGLIVAANTPIANVAWKVFPALICGNSVVLKAAEDTPATAWLFAKIADEAGLPRGLLNVIQGYGVEAGQPLVEDSRVGVISFTGSAAVGRRIGEIAGRRLAKVSLELGGKNPLVVCDDAELEQALNWTVLSAFSNAGQRCAAGSRVIVFDSIYPEFRDGLLERCKKLRVGPSDGDDFGPVINERQLNNMLAAIKKAVEGGASLLVGGVRLTDNDHRDGFYLAPTVLENVGADHEFSLVEHFGPMATLYRVSDFNQALELANHSPYGLTSSIHTTSFDRAMTFARNVKAGVVSINGGTYGSEPHMPFGGTKDSGNGTREPGTEALDIYSNLKNVYLNVNPKRV